MVYHRSLYEFNAGDFRLGEAMASGALVLIDPMFVPRPFPFLDKKHFVYYDNTNKTDLFVKLDYYRQNPELLKRTAISGYHHAMKYHRASNLIDYVFRTLHTKEIEEGLGTMDALSFKYRETGYQMRLEALARTTKL